MTPDSGGPRFIRPNSGPLIEYYAYPSLTRYFNHIQSLSSVRSSADALSPSFSIVQFDLENAPKAERKAEPSKKKDKKPSEETEKLAAHEPSAPVTVAPPPAGKAPKKEKKEKKKEDAEDAGGKKANSGEKAAPAAEGGLVPSMVCLRVGHIVGGLLRLFSLRLKNLLMSLRCSRQAS